MHLPRNTLQISSHSPQPLITAQTTLTSKIHINVIHNRYNMTNTDHHMEAFPGPPQAEPRYITRSRTAALQAMRAQQLKTECASRAITAGGQSTQAGPADVKTENDGTKHGIAASLKEAGLGHVKTEDEDTNGSAAAAVVGAASFGTSGNTSDDESCDSDQDDKKDVDEIEATTPPGSALAHWAQDVHPLAESRSEPPEPTSPYKGKKCRVMYMPYRWLRAG
jgi:hypothetical protein